MLLPPLVKLDVASTLANVRLYPLELFVLTVTVSLALDTTPLAVGVKVKLTGDTDEMLITSLTVALIVVSADCVAAETVIGEVATAVATTAQAAAFAFCLTVNAMVVMSLSIFIEVLPKA